MFSLFSKLHSAVPESLFYLLIPAYDQDQARQYIGKYGLTPESYMMEEVSHSDVGCFTGAADAGLLLREQHDVNTVSSPTKFGEYLASGLPVILTKGIGDYSEMAEQINIGLTTRFDDGKFPDEELGKLVQFCREISRNRNEWSNRCRVTAADYLEWKNTGKGLISLYEKLLTN